jgi:hypothetical protein
MAKPILPQPGSNANEPGTPSLWTQREVPVGSYPGAIPNNRDPRSMSEIGLGAPEEVPGSGVPGEPWKSVPSPAPRRLRRDK